jgi:hypothetical protein
LNVPPLLLLVPLGVHDRLRVTVKSEIHPHLALDWLAGDKPLGDSDNLVIGAAEWQEASEPLRVFRRLRPVQSEVHRAEGRVQQVEYAGTDKQIKTARAAFTAALQDLLAVHRDMRRVGLRPPRLPKSWKELVDRFHLDEGGD